MKMVALAFCGILFSLALTACQSSQPKIMKDCTPAQANLFICKDI